MNRFLPLALAGVAVGLSACYIPPSPEPPRIMQMGAALSGPQAAPPTASPANGAGSFTYDRITSQLNWTVNYAGLTGPLQAAQIVGPNGAGTTSLAQVNVPVSFSPLVGSVMLTPAQGQEFLSGRYVINLTTPAYPTGEIRGQIVPGQPVAMLPAQPVVVAPVAQPATTTTTTTIVPSPMVGGPATVTVIQR